MGELGHTGCYGGFNHDLINPRGFIDLTYGFYDGLLGAEGWDFSPEVPEVEASRRWMVDRCRGRWRYGVGLKGSLCHNSCLRLPEIHRLSIRPRS